MHEDTKSEATKQGTGFIISLADGMPAIVSNRHILDITWNDNSRKYYGYKLIRIDVKSRTRDDLLYSCQIDCTNFDKYSFVEFSSDYNNDVAVLFRPYVIGLDTLPNRSFHYHFGNEILADNNFFSSELEAMDVVAFTGFPEEHDVISDRPLLRSGRISSDPRFDFSIYGKIKGRCVAYEAFSNRGASGSPVFAAARVGIGEHSSRSLKLVGVNSGHLNSLSREGHIGLSYFYKSTVIIDILTANGETL